MQYKKIAAVVAVSLLPVFTLAEESADKTGFYGGTEFGSVKVQDLAAVCDSVGISCEDSGLGLGLSGGYRFNDYFAAEGGFRYSKIELTRFVHLDLTSFSLGGRVFFPVSEFFSPTLAAGFHSWDVDASTSSGTAGSIDGTDPYFGLGADFSLSDNFDIRASYNRYMAEDGEIDFISGNFVWRF